MSVLIATPTSKSKHYCFLPWIANVKAFSYPDLAGHLIVDNSPSPTDYVPYLQGFTDFVGYQPPGRSRPHEVLAATHNVIRDFFLKTDAEWLLHLESDVFPPHDVIERLLSHHRALVAGLYYLGNGADSWHCMFVWNDLPTYDMRQVATRQGSLGFNMADGSLQEVAAAGLGCVLIHRKVLEKVKFRSSSGLDKFPDTLFWMDAWAAGVRGYCDTSLHCEHRNQDWALNKNYPLRPDFMTIHKNPIIHTND